MRRRKIVYHLTPEADASPIYHEMVTRLAQSIMPQADVVLTGAAGHTPEEALAGCDLLHVFGCWNTAAAHLMARAYKEHVPTVLSPLGGLQPWVMKQHQTGWFVSSQRNTTAKALAIHVCGKLEQDTFVNLNWNSRLALIKNPVLTSKTSFEEMAAQMTHLYQKVTDTYARLLLSQAACSLIGQLVVAGVDDTLLHDRRRVEELRTALAGADDDEWRKVCIYASDEHITPLVARALERLQVDRDIVAADSLDRFARGYNYPDEPLESEKLLSRNPLTKSKLADIMDADEQRERRIIVALINLKHEMEHKRAPLAHLADVYRAVRFTDADEDRLNEVAREMGVLDFAERIMAVMHHTLGLTEGFMPFRENDDKAARLMTGNITKFNTY